APERRFKSMPEVRAMFDRFSFLARLSSGECCPLGMSFACRAELAELLLAATFCPHEAQPGKNRQARAGTSRSRAFINQPILGQRKSASTSTPRTETRRERQALSFTSLVPDSTCVCLTPLAAISPPSEKAVRPRSNKKRPGESAWAYNEFTDH